MIKEKIETILGEGTNIKGDLVSGGIIRLDGHFNGSVAGTTVIIGRSATVEADIKCTEIIICGKVKGNVTAEKSVEIQPGGELHGSLKAESTKVMPGARYTGNAIMGMENI